MKHTVELRREFQHRKPDQPVWLKLRISVLLLIGWFTAAAVTIRFVKGLA